MKFRLKRILACLAVACIVLICLWSTHQYINGVTGHSRKRQLVATTDSSIIKSKKISGAFQIDCVINDEYPISCLKGENEEVYIPFSFLKKYFEINGKLIPNEVGTESFAWQHSYSKGRSELK